MVLANHHLTALAQLVEHRAFNPIVKGSSPLRGIIFLQDTNRSYNFYFAPPQKN